MTIVVSSGVTSTLTVSSGDPVVVLSGGKLYDSTILSGGSATLSSGALGSGLTVSSGGVLSGPGELDGIVAVLNGGSVDGAMIASGGYFQLYGGTARGVTVTQFSLLAVDDGIGNDIEGTAIGTIVSDSGRIVVNGSAAGTVVSDGSQEEVDPGGVASGDTIDSGGFLQVDPGGTVSGETVSSGGTLDFSGPVTSDLTLGPAASTTVLPGVTVSSGGIIELFEVSVRSGATLSLGGAGPDIVKVDAGGVVAGPGEIGSGIAAGVVSGVTASFNLELVSGGSAIDVTVSSVLPSLAGLEIDSGATATGTVVSVNNQEIVSGGAASGTTVLDDGVVHVVSGTTVGTVLNGFRALEVVSSGGVASATTVSSLGAEYLLALATATSPVVSDGGHEVVSSGGVASGTTVLSGGLAYVLAGGVAGATTVSSGGHQVVSSGGLSVDASVSRGAEAVVYAGGTASGLTLTDGRLVDDGAVVVSGGGTLYGDYSGDGAIVELGGGDLLLSGGGAGFTGTAVISSGTIELARAGQLGTGAVEFVEPATGSAVLQIDAADAPAAGGRFANTIDDFSGADEDIDLRSIAYVSGASAEIVGSTLVLTDGGKTYGFDIAGSTADAYRVQGDGHGGTLIDPRALAFTQAAAAFAPPEAGGATPISSASPTGQAPFLPFTASATTGHG